MITRTQVRGHVGRLLIPLIQRVPSLYKLQKVFALLLLLGGVLLYGIVALNGESNSTRFYMFSNWEKMTSVEWTIPSKQPNNEENSWRANFTPQPWKAEYMGKANLHVFDEWCSSSISSLRNNVHFPLHPHIRTTVKALAVAPQQINYGLRIFGYLHPPADGEYVLALSSDDNSELWLSSDHSPLNLLLRAWVGKTGVEWTAPGEYDKFLNQTSMPIRLSAHTRYFFEVLLQQNNKGTDHVVVAWRHMDQSQDFVVIQSDHISLYVDESSLAIGDIDHIPQTAASHEQNNAQMPNSAPDIQKEDPRDTFFHVPMINNTLLSGLLPDCLYKPSYTVKGYRLPRYQGITYVHLSYIYPNDHTRLTHLDTETTCYYRIKPYLFKSYIVEDITKPLAQKDPPGESVEGLNNEIADDNSIATHARKIRSVDNNNWTHQEAFPHTKSKNQAKPKGKTFVQGKSKTKFKWKKTVVDRLQLGAKKSPLRQINSEKTRQRKSPKIESELEDKVDVLELSEFGDVSLDQWDWEEPIVQRLSVQEHDNKKPKWTQTFKINNLGYQGQASHALNMDCRLTGNIQIQETEVWAIVKAYMDKFNQKHSGWTLERVVNMVMNADVHNGKRYLVELELREESGALLRLSQYVYALNSTASPPEEQPRLCNPVGFRWTPEATVHFVIPVKNQARWVHLLIRDVEKLVKETGDPNFNLILTDFSSTDMRMEEALARSKIPRYQYKKLNGNFERSRGLQEGVNLIEDPHSIVFLFDLHIRFPSSIIDLIRKHCVEGHQAFAPIVMRLDCGASPQDAKGLWEVQGFGLLGIYKSDLDRVGGMNTREFKEHWGGEDWELLDRILEGGLEVERFYVRNFYHHFHTKRGMWTSRYH